MRLTHLAVCSWCFLLLACAAPAVLPTRAPTAAIAATERTASTAANATTRPPLPTNRPLPTHTPIPPIGLGAAAGVPPEIAAVTQDLATSSPQRFSWGTADAGSANDVLLVVNDGAPLARWIYAAAAPFATVMDDISWDQLSAAWQGTAAALGALYLDESTAAALAAAFGQPAAGAHLVHAADLASAMWADRPSWTIVPFNALTPDLKVLRVDGVSPLDDEFDLATYPLQVAVGARGDASAVARFLEAWNGPTSNFEPSRLTTVAMTGVTALARATAYQMEIRGITAPGTAVASVLQAADIAHASHEVAFAPNCPFPSPVGDPVFCARDAYLELLQSIGIDLVELTGNHLNDWGPENLLHSLELYRAAGMVTFGGGRDLSEAQQPALFEHKSNQIAFVGCNPVGPAFAWATESRAGSRPCDYPALYAQIAELRAAGYLVIATLQYSEFYHYAATGQQQADFRAVAEAGAAAVSGSQGHHAQGFDFHAGAFIHFGLGNLFFDQMEMLGTRQSFVDVYTIYEGRLINVELVTYLIEDYCCPRLMTADERAQLLLTVFQASGW